MVHEDPSISSTFVPAPTTHPDDAIVLSDYPWQKEAVVKLTRLPETDIDIWCGSVHKYYQYTPPLQIQIVSVRGACKQVLKTEIENEVSPPSVDETKELLDHAHNLLERVKVFATKPVQAKHRPTPKSGKQATSEALDALHSTTMSNLAPLHVGTDGDTTTAANEPSTKKRKVKCKMCPNSFPNVKELNQHHKDDHGVVTCKDCNKLFSSQSTLDKHSYVHKELKFNCEHCGRRFPFESRLEQHLMTHINTHLSWPKKSCPKTFKSVGDVNRHVKVHAKGGWYQCTYCDYKNKDKRNTESHMRTHTKEEDGKYVCDKCGKHMRYSTQFRRHKESGCDV